MQHSADVASMPRVPVEMFLQACRSAVALNASFVPPHESGAALYLRPQLYGSSAQLSLTAPDEYTFCVFAVPTGIAHGAHPVKALIIDEFDRTAPNGSGHAKLGGNYAPVLRWSDKARSEGYGITLHLDSARHEEVDEFSTCAFIGITADSGDDVTIAVPDSGCIIESITSDSILHIARGYGWKTEKRPIKYTELPGFTEVLAAGTAASLVPVRSITRRKKPGVLPTGPRVSSDAASETVMYMPESQQEAGPVCLKLLNQLKGIQQGKIKDESGWRFVVAEDDMKIDGAVAENGNQKQP
jgi:branched-chain amino acid aminotransferase